MRYKSAAAFRMALEQRLKMEAERNGLNLARRLDEWQELRLDGEDLRRLARG